MQQFGQRLILALMAVLVIQTVGGSDILVFLPLPLKSHTFAFAPIFSELASRGHNVTMVSPFPKFDSQQFHHILVPDLFERLKGPGALSSFPRYLSPWILKLSQYWIFGPLSINMIMKEEIIQNFITNQGSHFDLIFLETFPMQEVFLALGHRFKAPIVNLNSLEPAVKASEMTGNPFLYSYIPSFMLAASDHMSFWERTTNTLMGVIETIGNHIYYYPVMNALMKKHFKYPGSENLPPLSQLVRNTSLTLIDAHYSIGYLRPYQRNVIEVGGLSLLEAATPLPQDLQKFMDEAEEGVIYFSLGSFFNTTNLDEYEIENIFRAFGILQQRIVMKWENETLPGEYKNIFHAKWLPQASILSHPKCKLFITHAGIHGIYEAVYNAVPVLGYPLFTDQFSNIAFAENKGFGLKLNDMSEANILESIEKILGDSRYKNAAKRISQIVKDRPMTPLEEAVYWIEYVLRHEGATHLRPAVLDTPFYQYFLLDVFGFLVLTIVLFVVTMHKIIKALFRILAKNKKLPSKHGTMMSTNQTKQK